MNQEDIMEKEKELEGLQSDLQSGHTDLNHLQTENMSLQSDYDLGISRVKQLERELMDVLDYKGRIIEKLEVAESYVSGEGSRLGRIKCHRHGQLEGRFLERMQSRMKERQRKQADAVDVIRENVMKMKKKSLLIEEDIEEARKHVMEIEGLISMNQSNIQAKKAQIAQLEGKIRVMN